LIEAAKRISAIVLLGTSMASVNGSPVTVDGTEFVQTVLARLGPVETFAKWFYVFLVGSIVLMGFAIGVGGSGPWYTGMLLVWSVSLTVAAASTMLGALLGFLFGIPRSLQQQPASPPTVVDAAQQPGGKPKLSGLQAFRSNTSLEEISDWLTKIIIGIGLVQFQTFIAYLYKAALLSAAFVSGQPINLGSDDQLLNQPSSSAPFLFALILSSLIAGCLFVYLETRTRLTLLFVSAEKAVKDPDERLADSAERPVTAPPSDADSQRGPPNSPAPATQDDKEIAKLSREKLVDPKDIVGWASAQARVGNYDVAEDALRDALQKAPEDDEIRLRIADVRRLRGNFSGSIDMINEVLGRTSDPSRKFQLLRWTLRAALYLPEPLGFQKAISVSDTLMKENTNTTDPWLYLWRAAAFGQEYGWLQRNAGTTDQLKAARANALEAVRKTIQVSPDYDSSPRALLRELLNPEMENSDPNEDDLKVFKDDQEFKDVIHKDKPLN
jgi:tetratricopeptide (TPR) repeat protein